MQILTNIFYWGWDPFMDFIDYHFIWKLTVFKVYTMFFLDFVVFVRILLDLNELLYFVVVGKTSDYENSSGIFVSSLRARFLYRPTWMFFIGINRVFSIIWGILVFFFSIILFIFLLPTWWMSYLGYAQRKIIEFVKKRRIKRFRNYEANKKKVTFFLQRLIYFIILFGICFLIQFSDGKLCFSIIFFYWAFFYFLNLTGF